jgi:hypothetical protein
MNIAKSKANYLKTISRRKKRKTGDLKNLTIFLLLVIKWM